MSEYTFTPRYTTTVLLQQDGLRIECSTDSKKPGGDFHIEVITGNMVNGFWVTAPALRDMSGKIREALAPKVVA